MPRKGKRRTIARGIYLDSLRGGFALPAARTAIPVLLKYRRPPTVAGLVVAVVIRPSIERVARRAFSHVAEERFEAATPLLAHFDAAPAVLREVLTRPVVAALFGALPRFVRAGTRCADRMAVPIVRVRSTIFGPANSGTSSSDLPFRATRLRAESTVPGPAQRKQRGCESRPACLAGPPLTFAPSPSHVREERFVHEAHYAS